MNGHANTYTDRQGQGAHHIIKAGILNKYTSLFLSSYDSPTNIYNYLQFPILSPKPFCQLYTNSMLGNLTDLVKGLAGDAVVNNPDIPNEQNDAVVAEASHTVASGLQNVVAGGGLQNILSMFGGGQQTSSSLLNNPIVNMMTGHFASKLMSNFGLNSTQAGNVSSSLIPNVMSGLINKTNDPNNSSFTVDNLLHSLTGGQSTQVAQDQQASGDSGFSFQGLISKFTGGGSNGNGSSTEAGLQDILSKITGGAQNAQQQQGSGGLMNMIQGFFK